MVKGATPEWTDPQFVQTQLPQVVSAAHKANSKVLISVGGWSGSISFSTMAKSASSRKTFIDWNIKQIQTYKTDGVDIGNTNTKHLFIIVTPHSPLYIA